MTITISSEDPRSIKAIQGGDPEVSRGAYWSVLVGFPARLDRVSNAVLATVIVAAVGSGRAEVWPRRAARVIGHVPRLDRDNSIEMRLECSTGTTTIAAFLAHFA